VSGTGGSGTGGAADVVVIGAGQAGLSAAYHLQRRGLEPGTGFVVLDAGAGPGGAWRHRWPSLTLDAAHALHSLPGYPLADPDPAEPASSVVTRYYGEFERRFSLAVRRPERVVSVSRRDESLAVLTASGARWEARTVISGTGTWDKPYWPYYPGREIFRGQQLHTRDFHSAAEFAGRRVVVVGAGTSAVQFLLQLRSAGASTVWSTRRAPQFTDRAFDQEWGRDVEETVSRRTRAGLPPGSVAAATGLPLTDEYRSGIREGVLVSRGRISRIMPDAVVFDDGSRAAADVILWATGFRASLDHLAPLRLREAGGGIVVDGVHVAREPRLFLVGYGASASTLGATRAGRAAAAAALQRLELPYDGASNPAPAPVT
jgi:cation diffusion facilitator CzcD-associated flavoprotein CzcO